MSHPPIPEDRYLEHYGILRRSGRYPWGSGGNVNNAKDIDSDPDKRSKTFLDSIAEMKAAGMTQKEIYEYLDISDAEFRALKTVALAERKAADVAQINSMKFDKGMSNMAISRQLGIPEPTVRSMLKPAADDKNNQIKSIADHLKNQVAEKTYVDVGLGVSNGYGVSDTRLAAALMALKVEGYSVHNVPVEQGFKGQKTNRKILVPPGVDQHEAWLNRDKIQQIFVHTEDQGRSFFGIHPPLSIDSKRVDVVFGGEKGEERDGNIHVRPGVEDLSIGAARYGQVRILVDGTHYIKGTVVYNPDLPEGTDIRFFTNKERTANKLDVLKPIDDEPGNPFGSIVRQMVTVDENGNERLTSAMNIVGTREGTGVEGAWREWDRNLPTQFLGKQDQSLIKSQLKAARDDRYEEFERIQSMTNPTLKKRLLISFGDETDSAAVHMKGKAFPGQSTHVLMPIPSMKDTEVYAPNYNNGDRVSLVRFPHGGKFEIPELVVNNRNPEARKLLGADAADAVGINHKVAARLSGADFDGDTVLVIPNNSGRVKNQSPLKGLEGFDPQRDYKQVPGMRIMKDADVQAEMGKISNLITDMQLRGATDAEVTRAVRHSMVVIDAKKHKLNYKLSEERNGIRALRDKYQTPYSKTGTPGASTLLSRAQAKKRIPEQKGRPHAEGGPIDAKTGKRHTVPTGRTYKNSAGERVVATTQVKRLSLYDDAFELTSGGSKKNPGTQKEAIYAEHSNELKALANRARKESLATKHIPYNREAKKAYQSEVDSLNAKFDEALRNRPRQRAAETLAGSMYKSIVRENPDMDDDQKKKVRRQVTAEARVRTGASKSDIFITDKEWAAIQAGALSHSRLDKILGYSDMERVKELAMPRPKKLMTSSKITRAKAMLNRGATQAEVAAALGVSLTTLKDSLG